MTFARNKDSSLHQIVPRNWHLILIGSEWDFKTLFILYIEKIFNNCTFSKSENTYLDLLWINIFSQWVALWNLRGRSSLSPMEEDGGGVLVPSPFQLKNLLRRHWWLDQKIQNGTMWYFFSKKPKKNLLFVEKYLILNYEV